MTITVSCLVLSSVLKVQAQGCGPGPAPSPTSCSSPSCPGDTITTTTPATGGSPGVFGGNATVTGSQQPTPVSTDTASVPGSSQTSSTDVVVQQSTGGSSQIPVPLGSAGVLPPSPRPPGQQSKKSAGSSNNGLDDIDDLLDTTGISTNPAAAQKGNVDKPDKDWDDLMNDVNNVVAMDKAKKAARDSKKTAQSPARSQQ